MLSRADPRPNLRYFNNSVNFRNLQLLEEKIDALKPPAWPSGAGEAFQIKADLAREGQRLFLETCADKCHGDPRTTVQGFVPTPAQVVGTDPKMAINAGRIVQTGRFNGTRRPPPSIGVYDDKAPAHEILASAVIGSILEEAAKGLQDLLPPSELRQNNGVWRAVHKDADRVRPNERSGFDLTTLTSVWEVVKYRLQNLFESPHPGEAAYEARALHGIWATAPYLHNGSVPNLWELLQPPHKRAPSFSVGDRTFDPRNVGFATDGSPYKTGTFVVDPANANGNGNRGHDYGTNLTDDQRWAIIEYLKTL
jgi:mono/diheme cytochrome c family protein